jgi:hypothetical protein
MPTFDEFIAKLRTLDIQEQTDIEPGSCRCFHRQDGSGAPIYLPMDFEGTDIVQPSQLTSWCRNLNIEPGTFGFDVGYLHNPFGAWEWE